MKVEGSSTIKDIKHSPSKKILTVTFTSDSVYEYTGVEKEVFNTFKVAKKKKESIGKLFAGLVKGKYEYKKLK